MWEWHDTVGVIGGILLAVIAIGSQASPEAIEGLLWEFAPELITTLEEYYD